MWNLGRTVGPIAYPEVALLVQGLARHVLPFPAHWRTSTKYVFVRHPVCLSPNSGCMVLCRLPRSTGAWMREGIGSEPNTLAAQNAWSYNDWRILVFDEGHHAVPSALLDTSFSLQCVSFVYWDDNPVLSGLLPGLPSYLQLSRTSFLVDSCDAEYSTSWSTACLQLCRAIVSSALVS